MQANNQTLAVISLGCAKNLVDSELISGLCREKGYILTSDWPTAAVVIINTCGFIEPAKQEAIDKILEVAEQIAPRGGYLVAAGCLAQRYGQDLLDEIAELHAVVGTGMWRDMPDIIERMLRGERVLAVGQQLSLQQEDDQRVLLTPAYSAYVKIADGCSNRCAYCAIPLIRGDMCSRAYEDIVSECRALVASGVKELNLIAQDSSNYGHDNYGKRRLPELLDELSSIAGDFWIRVLYCYPRHIDDALMDSVARNDKVCKYFDIPLQHGSDNVLRAMLRKDSKAQVVELLDKLRGRIPGVAIRTAFIVGFPGETAADFAELCQFVREQRFTHAGVFEYSDEEGTTASGYGDKVGESIAHERYHELMAIQSAVSEDVNRAKIGQLARVLVEGHEDGQPYGRSQYEAPEVDGRIYLETPRELQSGDWVDVRIIDGFAYDLLAEVID